MQLFSNPPPITRYGFAIVISVTALVGALLFAPLFERTPFLLFFLAVVLAAWYGGLGPGLVATIASLVMINVFLVPAISFKGLELTELVLLIVFTTVAVIVSLLYNARRRNAQQLSERLNTLSCIYQLSETVNRAPSVDVIFESALDALQGAIKADRASILLFDDQGIMQFTAWRGLSDSYRAAAAGHSPWTREARNPQPLLVPDVTKDPTLAALQSVIVGEGIRALAFIPLVSGERLLGKFMVYYNAPHIFEQQEIQAAQTIARHVAFALDRRETEEALRQSQRQLEVILQGITDGITVQEPSGKLVYANEAAARVLGFGSPEELLRTPVPDVIRKFEVLDETGLPLPFERLPSRIAMRGEMPQEQLVRFRVVETNAERWSVANAAPVFDTQGQVLFVVNMFRDFTERQRAERSEREQRQLLQVILSSIGDAVIATDANARITFMNPVATHLTEWSEVEARGKPLAEVFKLINEETRREVPSPVEKVLKEGTIVGLANHTLLVTRSGKERPIDDSGAPIRDIQGQAVGVVLVFRDVAEQRRSRIELGRLAAIVESSEDAIYAKSLEGIVTSWNQGAERLFGYPASEIIGHSVARMMLPELLSELDENLARIKNNQSIKSLETQRLHREGKVIDVSVTISPVKDSDGKIVGASTIARDVTERKRLEEERARLYAAEQLARAQAESAIRARDQFLSLASHELKTPITSIMGFAELVQRRASNGERLTDRDQRALQLIHAQSSHLAQLINSLLDLSRIDGEQFVIETAPMDLNALTTRVVESLRLTAEAHTLTFNALPEPLVIYGDEMRLEQVVQNLIQNAIKYTPGGGLIGITLEHDGAHAYLSVTDPGIGIPEVALDRLFERFYRAENVKAYRISGMGIGLFVAKQIVMLHGGEIQVKSREDAGSTFILCLPLAPLEPLAAEPTNQLDGTGEKEHATDIQG